MNYQLFAVLRGIGNLILPFFQLQRCGSIHCELNGQYNSV